MFTILSFFWRQYCVLIHIHTDARVRQRIEQQYIGVQHPLLQNEQKQNKFAHKHTDTQTHRYADTQMHDAHTLTHTRTHARTDTHTHTDPYTDARARAHMHKHKHNVLILVDVHWIMMSHITIHDVLIHLFSDFFRSSNVNYYLEKLRSGLGCDFAFRHSLRSRQHSQTEKGPLVFGTERHDVIDSLKNCMVAWV